MRNVLEILSSSTSFVHIRDLYIWQLSVLSIKKLYDYYFNSF